MERKTTVPEGLPPDLDLSHETTQRLLAERIAYHQAKIEEERSRRERRAARWRWLTGLFSRPQT